MLLVQQGQGSVSTRVRIAAAGNQGNSSSSLPSSCADCCHIEFASNLVLGDKKGQSDLVVSD